MATAQPWQVSESIPYKQQGWVGDQFEVTRNPDSSWYVVKCPSCEMWALHETPEDANAAALGHEKMHRMLDGLNRYFGLCGASIAYSTQAHSQIVGLN